MEVEIKHLQRERDELTTPIIATTSTPANAWAPPTMQPWPWRPCKQRQMLKPRHADPVVDEHGHCQ